MKETPEIKSFENIRQNNKALISHNVFDNNKKKASSTQTASFPEQLLYGKISRENASLTTTTIFVYLSPVSTDSYTIRLHNTFLHPVP